MTFAWPWALTALLLIPLLLLLAWWLRRRRRRAAVRVSSLALVRAALPGRSRWRRRIPVILLLVGIAVLGVGAARPQASVAVPSNAATILLAIDVSGSMCATDVEPNRISAAQDAASDFIRSQRGGPRIGLVAFAGTAGLLVSPTDDTDKLLAALRTLSTSRGTAIGQGIVQSLDAIAEVDPSVAPTGADAPPARSGYAADAVVVLTDGANTQGVDPTLAARQAAERRVKVFTIGFGTSRPTQLVCGRGQVGGDVGGGGGGYGFGGFGGFGGPSPLVADESALRRISSATGGAFYRAQNADQLEAALKRLPGTFTLVREQRDIAAFFAAGGGLLLVAAVALSLWWNRGPRRRA